MILSSIFFEMSRVWEIVISPVKYYSKKYAKKYVTEYIYNDTRDKHNKCLTSDYYIPSRSTSDKESND